MLLSCFLALVSKSTSQLLFEYGSKIDQRRIMSARVF
jgi:hypothetical protein